MKLLRTAIGIALLGLGVACAARAPGTRPDDMSAREHRSAAQSHRREASGHARQYDASARGRARATYGLPTVRGINDDEPLGSESAVAYGEREHNPTQEHRDLAEQHRKHAEQHSEAAIALEASTDAACRGLSGSARAECPLLSGVASIELISEGARVRLKDPASVQSFVARARCHHAFAREQRFQGMAMCPLYLPNIAIGVAGDGSSVVLKSSDPAIAAAIRERIADHAK